MGVTIPAVFATIPAAYAQTFVGCSTADLNTAITNANNSGGDTLFLSPGCDYDYTSALTGEDATPAITSRITIVGDGATIRRDPAATGTFRLIDIANGGTLSAWGLTIKNGNPTGDGGGVLVQGGGTLNATALTISGNTANRGAGVEINAGGTATIRATTIDGNTAALAGGGIDNPGGSLDLSVSRLTNNTAGTPLVGGGGGGYDQDDGTGTITATLISGNTSTFAGGGIDHDGGPLHVSFSTISNNRALGVPTGSNHPGGGGIWTGPFNAAETLTVDATTITGNSATSGDGGGIRNEFAGVLNLNASTVSDNNAGDRAGGIYNGVGSTINLKLSRIIRNTSATAPGGVYNAGTVTNSLSAIVVNSPTNCTPSPNPVPGCIN
ncbi:hypothetical protein [Kitasatospora aureofaciens]|uniref:hypothetical protein n=1 Tax=Kitasatospora aureofaciens TaxID=1894 RepID=UPI0036F4670C